MSKELVEIALGFRNLVGAMTAELEFLIKDLGLTEEKEIQRLVNNGYRMLQVNGKRLADLIEELGYDEESEDPT